MGLMMASSSLPTTVSVPMPVLVPTTVAASTMPSTWGNNWTKEERHSFVALLGKEQH